MISTPSVEVVTNKHCAKKPPVCRYTWLLKKCEISDCKKSHPTICEDPKCLDFDQDLPYWKSSGCEKWHGRSKTKKPKVTQKMDKFSTKSKSNSNQKEPAKARPSGNSGKPVISKPKGKQSQNFSRNSGSSFPKWSTQPQQQWNWHQSTSGNGQAPWRPLHRDGNNKWGIQKMPYNMAVKGQSSMTTAQLLQDQFQKMMQLINQAIREQCQWV